VDARGTRRYRAGMRLALVLACASVLALGCHHHRHTLVPRVPTTGDANARHRFEVARARFERDGSGGEEMAAIARDYPDDPIAPYAQVYAGIAEVRRGDYPGAVRDLTPAAGDEIADVGLRTRARLFLGLADGYLGRYDQARPLLAAGEQAIASDAEKDEWTAASATAIAAGPRPLDALPWFDRWWPRARAAERGYILARVGELVAATPDEALIDAWRGLEKKDGPSAALLGPRVVEQWVRLGEAGDDARRARDQADDARRTIGLPELPPLPPPPAADHSVPGLIGAALPMTGRAARLGELALHGLAVAAGALGGPGEVNAVVRDASSPDHAAAAVDQLAEAGAIAVIGPIESGSVDAAAAEAAARGIPLISLNPRAEDRRAGGAFAFHIVHSAEARARVLARRASRAGVTRVAILAPASGYGRVVGKAFADELTRGGGQIVTEYDYPAQTRSFAGAVEKLRGSWQAVFIPEAADQLELIAPALDAGGLIPRPWGEKRKHKLKGGRAILVLSTAEGAGPALLHASGRHLYGAWLAPGFFPDPGDPTIAAYVDRFQQAFGRAPTAIDAYAYDAATAVARAAAGSRADLVGKLAAGRFPGVTGEVRFDAAHRRADDGIVFVVEDDGAGGALVKAQR
jgi:ABC-type branched-subunit amino acid transport system substrate-binding protein